MKKIKITAARKDLLLLIYNNGPMQIISSTPNKRFWRYKLLGQVHKKIAVNNLDWFFAQGLLKCEKKLTGIMEVNMTLYGITVLYDGKESV